MLSTYEVFFNFFQRRPLANTPKNSIGPILVPRAAIRSFRFRGYEHHLQSGENTHSGYAFEPLYRLTFQNYLKKCKIALNLYKSSELTHFFCVWWPSPFPMDPKGEVGYMTGYMTVKYKKVKKFSFFKGEEAAALTPYTRGPKFLHITWGQV